MPSLQPISDIRKDYKLKELSDEVALPDPIQQFDSWWNEALASHIEEVNAMTLATVSPEGLPDARIVLLKGYDAAGFVFFTNYDSAKGKDLEVHPHACLVLFWKELERQVRISGQVQRVSPEESDAYYHSRPAGSQIGAWASPQSQVIAGRRVLEENVRVYSERFSEGVIPRPPHWGGYRLIPGALEFWQGRPSRLHDRLLYTFQEGPSGPHWAIQRLAP